MPPLLTFPGWPVSRARAGPVRVQGERFASNLPPLWAIPSRGHLACKQGVAGSNPASGFTDRSEVGSEVRPSGRPDGVFGPHQGLRAQVPTSPNGQRPHLETFSRVQNETRTGAVAGPLLPAYVVMPDPATGRSAALPRPGAHAISSPWAIHHRG